MSLNQNQFAMTPIQGALDLPYNFNTKACQVDSSVVTALLPAQPVKIQTDIGGVPKLVAAALDTDDIFGFVNYNLKNANFPALAAVEVSNKGNVMWMQASGAISRGAKLNVVIATVGMVQSDAGGGKTVIGRALDGAANSGDLIRVEIGTPV